MNDRLEPRIRILLGSSIAIGPGKAALLAELGIDAVVAYPTDDELLRLAPEEFFQRIVREQLDARAMIEGPNFCFGRGRSGTIDVLRSLCAGAGISLGRQHDNVAELSVGDENLLAVDHELVAIPPRQDAYTPLYVVRTSTDHYLALFGRSPHLGCRIVGTDDPNYERLPGRNDLPFEDPCDGGYFTLTGAKVSGPSPRGLDRFGITVANGKHKILEVVPKEKTIVPPACTFA